MVDSVDVAVVSLGTTPGLRRSDEAFAGLVREAGASCELVPVRIGVAGKLRRHPALTDLVEALAARRSGRPAARAVVYSSVTAALLQPAPGVPWSVRYDSPAALNRPGWGGAWQRARERRALAGATVLMPLTRAAADATPDEASGVPSVLMPVPVDPVESAGERDIDAVAYAGYPRKRGLELICDAWAEAAPAGRRLVVGGVAREKALRWLERCGVSEPAGVSWAGELGREEWLGTVARARLYVNGSRWEEFGIAQLEALAAGTPLATVPTPGPNAALPLARELGPELVAGELTAAALAGAIQKGLGLGEAERRAYAERARELLRPFARDTLRARLAERVLPALGLS